MIVLVLHYVLSETPHGTFMPEPPLNLSSAALNEIEQGVENTIANGKKIRDILADNSATRFTDTMLSFGISVSTRSQQLGTTHRGAGERREL